MVISARCLKFSLVLCGLCFGCAPNADPPVRKPEFKVLKTIKVGTNLKTAADFREAFRANGMEICDSANYMLDSPQFNVAKEQTELCLVAVSVAELGFKKGAATRQIYARAEEFGLDICPAEVGPLLRLQYKDQPISDRLVIGMSPILGLGGRQPMVFSVERYKSGFQLDGNNGGPEHTWLGCERWIFVRP